MNTFLCTLKHLTVALLLTCFTHAFSAQVQTVRSGSFIFNLGIVPQTVNNGLKPYGMMYRSLKSCSSAELGYLSHQLCKTQLQQPQLQIVKFPRHLANPKTSELTAVRHQNCHIEYLNHFERKCSFVLTGTLPFTMTLLQSIPNPQFNLIIL
jgi:hypothetical protein